MNFEQWWKEAKLDESDHVKDIARQAYEAGQRSMPTLAGIGMAGDANMTRGEFVEAKLADGRLVRRIVWDATSRLVYLCSEPQYKALLEGLPTAPPAIGFPIEDVKPLEPSYA